MVKIDVKGTIMNNDTAWLYRYWGMEVSCPRDILEGLKRADGDDVVVEINSNGGVCTAGFEMYKLLMEYEGNVEAHVINAASAASFVVCGADRALASDGAILMIHNTQCSASGDYRVMQMEAEALKEFNEGIINMYVRKTKRSREELQELMDNTTFMSPAKAMEYGFIDGYLFGNPDGADDGDGALDMRGMQVLNGDVQIIPDEKVREMIALIKGTQPDGFREQNNSTKCADSDREKQVNESKKGDFTNMTLEEFLKQNPEARAEVEALRAGASALRAEASEPLGADFTDESKWISRMKAEQMAKEAREEGASLERSRLEELDSICKGVSAKALAAAKYGKDDERMDAGQLALEVMKQDSAMASDYMRKAMGDSTESHADEVGCGTPEGGELDESDELAGYANARKCR